ncbi:MAG: hypothetical protein KGZ71_06510 [Desulfobulbaceae bacterium]|nr:hypothetical protein [Desulfobulbaceae bacterium]
MMIRTLNNLSRIILLTVFILPFLVISFTNNTTAKPGKECESPFSSIIVDNIWVNGCEYEVEICFMCAYIHPFGAIQVLAFTKKDPECPYGADDTYIANEIDKIVTSYSFIKTFICVNNEIAPCENQQNIIEYTVIKNLCWVKQKFMGNIWFKVCPENDNTCDEVWRYCWDATANPPQAIKILQSYSGSVGKCPTGPVKDPENEFEETECFTIPNSTLCNPSE